MTSPASDLKDHDSPSTDEKDTASILTNPHHENQDYNTMYEQFVTYDPDKVGS